MRRMARDPNTGMRVPETPGMFYARDLSPIQVTSPFPFSYPSLPSLPCRLQFIPHQCDAIWERPFSTYVYV
jgi:hypothetical protein